MSRYKENFNYSSYICENEVGQTQNKTRSKLGFLISVPGVILGVLVSLRNGIFLCSSLHITLNHI